MEMNPSTNNDDNTTINQPFTSTIPLSSTTTPSQSSSQSSLLSARQRKASRYYDRAKLTVFGPNDYSLIAPNPVKSLFVSDETLCLAEILFGASFDLYVREFALRFWFPAFVIQMVCLPLGVVGFYKHTSHWIDFACVIGGIFPILLLLRSHWHVMWNLFQSWEPIFLTVYSIAFCVANAYLVNFGYKCFYIFGAVLPTLLSSAYSDASALRLDYAFLKGEISLTVLALPPYLAALTAIIALLIASGAISFNGQSNVTSTAAKFQSAVFTTGLTLSVFLARSIVLLIFEPNRCVSLHAPMLNTTATLVVDSSRQTESVTRQGYRKLYVSCVLSGKIEIEDEDSRLASISETEVMSPIDNSNRLLSGSTSARVRDTSLPADYEENISSVGIPSNIRAEESSSSSSDKFKPSSLARPSGNTGKDSSRRKASLSEALMTGRPTDVKQTFVATYVPDL